ncbi:nitroreductase family protein [Streptomyces sp. me109]|uniref:nitroreductase family protein n=1 Tax=Streptomyces sp. me109 TaxID=1827853 RepID=UPI0011CDFF80|nr:nitroreductase family protein [Streptomyces sp. me109]TXS70183.1 nitroreductase family protein [Streptomyces sp. me109]
MKPDTISVESQCRILDAAIRAPNGGNTQRWHFLAVDDAGLKSKFAELYASCREREYADIAAGRLGAAPHEDAARRAESLARIKKSGDYFTDHFNDIPLLLFVFAVDDHGGANIYPAIWSCLLAARAEGIGGVPTTVLRYEADRVCELLGVPREDGWRMISMLAFGYPLGRWGVAANRRPVHEVSSRNHWGRSFGARVPEPLWPSDEHRCAIELPSH